MVAAALYKLCQLVQTLMTRCHMDDVSQHAILGILLCLLLLCSPYMVTVALHKLCLKTRCDLDDVSAGSCNTV